MIELKNVTKRFSQGKTLFRGLQFLFGKGDFVYITGPSGAGKTSLLHLVYGFLPPSEGAVLVEGENLYELDPTRRALLRRRMGIVFQDFRLIPHLTVDENLALPLEIQKVETRVISREVDRVIERVGLHAVRSEYPETLSGGEQQRVAIARAIIHRPEWLFADEPTGNLDPKTAFEIMTLFHEIHGQGTSIIIATHDENLLRHGRGLCLRLENGQAQGMRLC